MSGSQKLESASGGSVTIKVADTLATDEELILPFMPNMAAGILFDFGGAKAPKGAVVCDGQELETAKYPELFNAIGHIWDNFGGLPNPKAGNFRVPSQNKDGYGLYSRGVGAKNGVVGTFESDVIRNITGMVAGNYTSNRPNVGSGALQNAINGGKYAYSTGTYHGTQIDFDASRIVPTGPENRPKSMTVLKCIWTGRY